MHKHPSLSPVTPPSLSPLPSLSLSEPLTVMGWTLIVCRSVQFGLTGSLLHCGADLGPTENSSPWKINFPTFLMHSVNLSVTWWKLNVQNGTWAFCPQLRVAVVRAPHSWILCNCKGPLLNSVPRNLIFTAAPDHNHLALLVRLYWKWKIATAVYCFK